MKNKQWSTEEIRKWVESQTGLNYWYQSIPIKDGIITPGEVNSKQRLKLMGLPDDLSGKSVLDIGCNSGMLCFECKKRNAKRVIGIDLETHRLEQARTLAEIMDLDVEFQEVDFFRAADLGQFDYVFSIAVVTEMTDLLRALEILKQVSKGVLYLELATIETFPKGFRILGIDINSLLELNLNTILSRFGPQRLRSFLRGKARLRRIESKKMKGWALVPDKQFLNSIMGDEFDIKDLGVSERYNLFEMSRKK